MPEPVESQVRLYQLMETLAIRPATTTDWREILAAAVNFFRSDQGQITGCRPWRVLALAGLERPCRPGELPAGAVRARRLELRASGTAHGELALYYRDAEAPLAEDREALGRCFAAVMGMALARESSARELGQLLRGAAHDLRGSVARSGGLADLLAARPELTEESRQIAGLIGSNLNTLDPLLRELAAYFWACEGHGPLEDVAIGGAVEDARYRLRRRLEDCGAKLAYEGGPEQVRTRQRDLANVMERLIDNSLKFGGEQPHIRVTPESSETGVRVTVQDSGPGIAGEYAEQVFEPFRRLHGKEYPGRGLGLTICRKLVEASGGRIWVDTRPAIGATIRMWFPRGL